MAIKKIIRITAQTVRNLIEAVVCTEIFMIDVIV
jgi:hypothetical protein